jgi:hypothetical protein
MVQSICDNGPNVWGIKSQVSHVGPVINKTYKEEQYQTGFSLSGSLCMFQYPLKWIIKLLSLICSTHSKTVNWKHKMLLLAHIQTLLTLSSKCVFMHWHTLQTTFLLQILKSIFRVSKSFLLLSRFSLEKKVHWIFILWRGENIQMFTEHITRVSTELMWRKNEMNTFIHYFRLGLHKQY